MILLVGASASGKSVVARKLIENYGYKKIVTYTTREIRNDEENGVDYHFISKDEFIKKINESFFIEYAIYNDNYYGTALKDLKGLKVLIVEPNGANVYINKLKNDVKVVYLEASEEVRKERMFQRGDKEESINNRLISDNDYFKKDNIKRIDLSVDTSCYSVDEIASLINSKE